MRSIVGVQLSHIINAASRFASTMLHEHIRLLHSRVITRTLLHEPALPDAEPDDTAESKKQYYDWHRDGDGESRGRNSTAGFTGIRA
jgi:hypothetical protein